MLKSHRKSSKFRVNLNSAILRKSQIHDLVKPNQFMNRFGFRYVPWLKVHLRKNIIIKNIWKMELFIIL